MEFTKFAHSCVRFDDGDRTLVVDPGIFSDNDAALDGADGVLITHEHADHVVPDVLRAALQGNSRLRVWATPAVAGQFEEFGEQVVAVGAGESFDAVGFAVRTFGGQHAVIHPTIPVIANVGYLIDEQVCHPGDSLIVPAARVDLLLAPIHAPWSKASEVIDYVVAVRAPRTIGIHDALLTDAGRGIVENHVARIGGEHGVEYGSPRPGDTISV